MKRNKKVKRKIIEQLREKAILNTNPGRVLRQKYPKITRKTRKGSSRKTIFVDDEDYPYQETFLDKWDFYGHDLCDLKGKRIWDWTEDDFFRFFVIQNEKVKKEQDIRKAKKLKKKIAN